MDGEAAADDDDDDDGTKGADDDAAWAGGSPDHNSLSSARPLIVVPPHIQYLAKVHCSRTVLSSGEVASRILPRSRSCAWMIFPRLPPGPI